jgi:hypothetical protein
MTQEEAAVVLGLDPEGPLEPAAVRKAYLAAVKRYKPESDPEGFKRVRRAYEVLSETRKLMASVAATPGASPSGKQRPADSSDLAALRQRLAALPVRPWQPRAALARELHRRSPKEPGARELLIQELAQAAQWTEVVRVLREATRAGDRWCLVRLVANFPAEAEEGELELLRAEGTAASLLLLAAARVGRDQSELAFAAVEQALAQVPVEALPAPLVHQTLVIILQLHQRGHSGTASAVFAALSRSLGPAGLRAGASERTTLHFLLCTELENAPDLPAELRNGLARAALTDDPSWASDALEVFARHEGSGKATRLMKRLEQKAPTVRRLFGRARFDSRVSIIISATGIVLIATLLFFKLSGQLDPSVPPADGWDLQPRHREYLRLCRGHFETAPCQAIDHLFGTMWSRDGCQRLPAEAEALRQAAASGAMKDYVQELAQFASSLCQDR